MRGWRAVTLSPLVMLIAILCLLLAVLIWIGTNIASIARTTDYATVQVATVRRVLAQELAPRCAMLERRVEELGALIEGGTARVDLMPTDGDARSADDPEPAVRYRPAVEDARNTATSSAERPVVPR